MGEPEPRSRSQVPPGRRTRQFLPVVVAAGLGVGFATAAAGGTITVTSLADAGPGSLRQALADATGGDTIAFAVTGTIALSSGELLLDKALTLSGPSAALLAVDAGGTSRVLHVSDGDPGTHLVVRIERLTLANGSVVGAASGGCILNAEDLTLADSVVRDGESEAQGGGIYNLGGQQGSETGARLTLARTSVLDNVANRGGGLFNQGGVAGQTTGASARLEDALFAGNFSQRGGAIFNDGGQQDDARGATMAVLYSTISGNDAQIQGGGFYNDGGRFDQAAGATLLIVGSEVDGNRALRHPDDPGTGEPGPSAYGGGIYNDGSWLDDSGGATLTVVRSRISNNEAGYFIPLPPPAVSPVFSGLGGGIYNDRSEFLATTPGGAVFIRSSTISHNEATRTSGGVGNAGATGRRGGNFRMTNSLLFQNNAPQGAALANDGEAQVTNVTITRNTFFPGNLGAVVLNGSFGELELSFCTIVDNYISQTDLDLTQALWLTGGVVRLKANLIDNLGPLGGGNNCWVWEGAAVSDLGYNLLDDGSINPTRPTCPTDAPTSQNFVDAQVAAVPGNHGGPTQTVPIALTSPALDAVPALDCTDAALVSAPVTTDQRGLARPQGAACDVGAYEREDPYDAFLFADSFEWGDPYDWSRVGN